MRCSTPPILPKVYCEVATGHIVLWSKGLQQEQIVKIAGAIKTICELPARPKCSSQSVIALRTFWFVAHFVQILPCLAFKNIILVKFIAFIQHQVVVCQLRKVHTCVLHPRDKGASMSARPNPIYEHEHYSMVSVP
jgi:hypothetical protein